jgi:uncharacterized protein (TIGR03663 family)
VIARPADLSRPAAGLARVRTWAGAWGREAVPFATIAVVGLALRLVRLDSMPLHHDETQHAWFAWQYATGHGYSYDPVYHGPVQFNLIALAYLLFGAGDYVTRLPPALMGTIAVFLPFLLRRQLGTVAALTASFVLCLMPSFLYFSRFAREDIYVACVTLAMVVVFLRFLDSPRRWHPAALLGLVAVSFATKETTYITLFLGSLFVAGVLLVQSAAAVRAGRRILDGDLLRSVRLLGLDAWVWGVSTFLLVYTLLFSTFLTNPVGLQEGLWGSLDYWLSQQPVNRGGQPWFYYLLLIPAYEWPVVILGLVGIVVVLRRPTVTRVFLLWMFVGSLAVFSWASERMPWLVLHPLLPLVLLAGIGAQQLWDVRARLGARVALAVVAVAAVGAAYASFGLTYLRPADARELLVQVQTSDDVPGVRDRVLQLQAAGTQRDGKPLVIHVDRWGGTGWPWGFYLRDVPAGYYDMSDPDQVSLSPVMLVADPNHAAMQPRLGGYVSERFRLRVWWVPDWGAAGPGDWVRWALFREPWNRTATMDEWLYVKPDLARLVPSRS